MATSRSANSRSLSNDIVPDLVYDYEFAFRNTEKLLRQDPQILEADRKLIWAFIRQVRAQGVSAGRQAKLLNHLRRIAQLIPVAFSKAKRGDIEELVTRLAKYEWVGRSRNGTIYRRTHYSPETMSDFRNVIKRFMKFVRYGNIDRDTPYPDEVKWIRATKKMSEKREPEYFTDEEAEAMIKAATSLRDKALISLWAEIAGGHPRYSC
jgi:integrase